MYLMKTTAGQAIYSSLRGTWLTSSGNYLPFWVYTTQEHPILSSLQLEQNIVRHNAQNRGTPLTARHFDMSYDTENKTKRHGLPVNNTFSQQSQNKKFGREVWKKPTLKSEHQTWQMQVTLNTQSVKPVQPTTSIFSEQWQNNRKLNKTKDKSSIQKQLIAIIMCHKQDLDNWTNTTKTY